MKRKKIKKKPEKEIKPPAVDPDKSNQFDFGGLPQRDLKKSLGCG
jgi:hypothetical protein